MGNLANESTSDDTIIWYWVCLSEVNFSKAYLTQEVAQAASDTFDRDDGFCNYYDDGNTFHRVLSMRWSKYKKARDYANKVNVNVTDILPEKENIDQF